MKKGMLIFGLLMMLSACGEKDFDGQAVNSSSALGASGTPVDPSFPSAFGGTAAVPGTSSAPQPVTGAGSAPIPPKQPVAGNSPSCFSGRIVGTVAGAPAGVSAEILKTYDDVLGRIDIYEAGARYLTDLQNQGYTVRSLRRDLIKTPEFAALLQTVYLVHLKRLPTAFEVNVHFNDLYIEATTMRAIENELSARCSRGGN